MSGQWAGAAATQRQTSIASAGGPEAEKKRRLAETDVDPSGDVTSDSSSSGETESVNSSNRDNQPAESHEDPTCDRDSGGNRDSENLPKDGQQE
jgi:hypothetical protein